MSDLPPIYKRYYQLRPWIPRALQIALRRLRAQRLRLTVQDRWPILEEAGAAPSGWTGWPGNKKFALVLSHDVEHAKGQSKVLKLMALEKERGFRSVYNFVPKRYTPDFSVHEALRQNGFEVAVHGLYHDGRLYESKKTFLTRAEQINQILADWNATGFCSPASHHHLEWMHHLNIDYDCSTFDVDPFEPQEDGMKTIFPFWVKNKKSADGFVELPYTLPQDHCLFIVLQEKTIDVWKRKLDWIVEKGGMARFITHPDYMSFDGKKSKMEEYPVELYLEFLDYIRTQYADVYWHVLPNEVATFWKEWALAQKLFKSSSNR